jgi:hypothetical protein
MLIEKAQNKELIQDPSACFLSLVEDAGLILLPEIID